MSDWIPESLLEMHFHPALIDYYSKKYDGKFVRLLKPVPQKEVWVGFDQGWISSKMNDSELFASLKTAIISKASTVDKFYVGEFLQFKIVDLITRRSKKIRANIPVPFYRSKLSLEPNRTTGISQHETLIRLNKIKGAYVYYACGMIFSQDDLWRPPSLNDLRFVDIQTAPTGWLRNENHFILFQNPTDSNPFWCSEPVPGKAYGISELSQLERLPNPINGEEAVELIREIANTKVGTPAYNYEGPIASRNTYASRMPICFSLIEFERN